MQWGRGRMIWATNEKTPDGKTLSGACRAKGQWLRRKLGCHRLRPKSIAMPATTRRKVVENFPPPGICCYCRYEGYFHPEENLPQGQQWTCGLTSQGKENFPYPSRHQRAWDSVPVNLPERETPWRDGPAWVSIHIQKKNPRRHSIIWGLPVCGPAFRQSQYAIRTDRESTAGWCSGWCKYTKKGCFGVVLGVIGKKSEKFFRAWAELLPR